MKKLTSKTEPEQPETYASTSKTEPFKPMLSEPNQQTIKTGPKSVK